LKHFSGQTFSPYILNRIQAVARKSKGPWFWKERGEFVVNVRGKRHYLGDDREAAFDEWHRGEGHACTWRTMLIKVAATIVVSTRRIRVLLSGSWPYRNFYQIVSQAVLGFTPPALHTG
jgi:hypothetical protein